MELLDARIRENTALVPGNHRLVLAFPKAVAAEPGQFFQLRVSDADEAPLLRRPLSIAGIRGCEVTFYYQVVGTGTRLLAGRLAGERLSALGPLGTGFPRHDGPMVLLGGGLGAATLLFLAARLRPAERRAALVFLGARAEACHFLLPAFEALGCAPACATDNGSLGRPGTVTALLQAASNTLPARATVYACGPTAMLREAARVLSAPGRRIYVSLETMMACGFGVCNGCAVPTRHGYLRACVDGPVFDAADIDWDRHET